MIVSTLPFIALRRALLIYFFRLQVSGSAGAQAINKTESDDEEDDLYGTEQTDNDDGPSRNVDATRNSTLQRSQAAGGPLLFLGGAVQQLQFLLDVYSRSNSAYNLDGRCLRVRQISSFYGLRCLLQLRISVSWSLPRIYLRQAAAITASKELLLHNPGALAEQLEASVPCSASAVVFTTHDPFALPCTCAVVSMNRLIGFRAPGANAGVALLEVGRSGNSTAQQFQSAVLRALLASDEAASPAGKLPSSDPAAQAVVNQIVTSVCESLPTPAAPPMGILGGGGARLHASQVFADCDDVLALINYSFSAINRFGILECFCPC